MNVTRRLLTSFSVLVALGCCLQSANAQPFCPAPATNAFTGCYFPNISLTGNPAFIRTDTQINFSWGKVSPDTSLQAQNFSVRWKGTFAFSAGVYTFNLVASDGIRLYLDGNLLLDRWFDHAPTAYSASTTVSAGSHLVSVDYYDYNGTATAQVSWKGSGGGGGGAPVISSFTASPSTVKSGQPATLSWNVADAASLAIDSAVGDVTGRPNVTVTPTSTTKYTLTASNASGSSSASVAVSVTSSPDSQKPTIPVLISAIALNAKEVDLAWSASTDDTGVAGYAIDRDGSFLTQVPGTSLIYADTTVAANTVYTYSMSAFDAAGNISAESNSIQVKTPGPPAPGGTCPAPATGSFTGCYYNNINLTGNPVLVRNDPQINFYWGNGSPDPTVTPLNFSARWQGTFQFPAGIYNFSVITSDGMRLYVDGVAIIDRWRDQSANQYLVSQSMSAGSHLIVVEYYERLGGATAQVSWNLITPVGPGPAISSFTATPSTVQAGQPVTLAWNVTGATALAISQGIGNVTGFTSITVRPVLTTAYTLTASNGSGTVTATVTVTVTSGPGSSSPTAPTLLAATVITANEVDLAWTLSTSPIGIGGYQVLRDGVAVGNVPSSANSLFFADTGVVANSTYSYTVKSYDPAGNFSAPSNSLTATTPAGLNVTAVWYGACWQTATIFGITGQFQAMDFALTTSTPVPLQGTLFFAANCDPSNGTDNMNDFNTLTPATHMIQGFSHHPDEIPTSAFFWIGGRTADGRCPAGAPCSGCVNYNKATPSCDLLP